MLTAPTPTRSRSPCMPEPAVTRRSLRRRSISAALVAASRFDLDTAEQHLAAAIELEPSADAYTARARVRMGRAEPGSGGDRRQAGDLARRGAAAMEVTGRIAYYQRHYDEARALADEAAGERPRTRRSGSAPWLSPAGSATVRATSSERSNS